MGHLNTDGVKYWKDYMHEMIAARGTEKLNIEQETHLFVDCDLSFSTVLR